MKKNRQSSKLFTTVLSVSFLASYVVGNNENCTKQPFPILNLDTYKCINKEDCKKTVGETRDLYLTLDQETCGYYQPDCLPIKRDGTPGYSQKIDSKVDYIECTRCSQSKPAGIKDQCGQCPGDLIFSQYPTDTVNSCLTIKELLESTAQNPSLKEGTIDPDSKILQKGIVPCPPNSIDSTITIASISLSYTYKKCEWCPIDKPLSIDQKTCSACPSGQIGNQDTHTCINSTDCQLISNDGNVCYQSKCPLGFIIDTSAAQKKCIPCKDINQYPSADQSKCVSKCSENNEVIHEKSHSCILYEDCDGYYSDLDSTVCLKDSCQRVFATFDLPASIVLDKEREKKYQKCQVCPKDKPFVAQRDSISSPSNKCSDCSTDYYKLQDFVSGICTDSPHIQKEGLLDEEKKILYPLDKYQCKPSYFPKRQRSQENKSPYYACTQCESHQPISDGKTCTNVCPQDQIADAKTKQCQPKDFVCSQKLSFDKLLCSPACKSGEYLDSNGDCAQCAPEKPYSSYNFYQCLSKAECYLDFENNKCFEYINGCIQKGPGYFYQKDDIQTCKPGCPSELLPSYDYQFHIPACLDKCSKELFTSTTDRIVYECVNSCPKETYADNENMVCQFYSECKGKLVTGSPVKYCKDKCEQGEVIMENVDRLPYTECLLEKDCPYGIVEQQDKSLICTGKCKNYAMTISRRCVNTCPEPNLPSPNKVSGFPYALCYEQCLSKNGTIQYKPADGQTQCIQIADCPLYQNGDKCSQDCDKGSIVQITNENGNLKGFCKQDFQCTYSFLYVYKDYKICSKTCLHFLAEDGITCLQKCPDQQFALEKVSGKTYQQCTKICDKLSYIDFQGILQCSSTCTMYLSADKSKCLQKCETGQYVYEKKANESFQQCSPTCNLLEYIDDKGVKNCNTLCKFYLSSNKRSCINTCGPTDFVNDKVEGETHIQCLTTCPDISFTDDKGVKRCSKTCPLYLSADKSKCTAQCSSDEFANEKDPNQTHIQCTKSCSIGTYEFVDEKGMKFCIKVCNLNLSSDQKKCVKACNPTDFVIEKQQGQTYSQCSDKCEKIEFVDDSNIKRCISTCSFYLSIDGKTCKKSCSEGEYANDKESGKTHFQCAKDCSNFEYYLDDKVKRCGKECPQKQIESISNTQKICIKSKTECKTIISQDSKKCIDKCDATKFEYVKQMNGFKQCFTCNTYYTAETLACTKTCSDNQVGIPSLMKCISQADVATECLNLKLSADKKKCVEKCEYPEIQTSKGECKKPCLASDSTCKQCEDNEFIYIEGSQESCLEKCTGDFWYSSDKKRCVNFCRQVGEIQPSGRVNVCIKCKSDETPVVSINTDGDQIEECKKKEDPKNFEDSITTAQIFLQSEIESKDVVEVVKKQLGEVSKGISNKVAELKGQHAKELINQITSMAKQLVEQIKLSEFSDNPQTIGSKETIVTTVQKVQAGYKFKSTFSATQIQNGGADSLLEENLGEEEETISTLAATVIANNPACNSEACKTQPLFVVDASDGGKRLLAESKEFTVTFNVQDTKDINKYVCLSYDLGNTSAAPTKTNTSIGKDNKSISCLVQGSVSILLDSKCQYIDKKICETINPNPIEQEEGDDSDSSDDELSGGAIAGIVIGVIAFVGIVVILTVHLLRKRNLSKAKKYEETQKDEKDIKTLGVLQTEQKLNS